MKSSVEVRPISETDFPAVCILEQGLVGTKHQSAVFVRQSMTLWPELFLIAVMDNLIAGYLVGSTSGDHPPKGWILRVRVVDGMRRKRVATTMMNYIEDTGSSTFHVGKLNLRFPSRR